MPSNLNLRSLRTLVEVVQQRRYNEDEKHRNHDQKYELTKGVMIGLSSVATFAKQCLGRAMTYARQHARTPGPDIAVIADHLCCRFPHETVLTPNEVERVERCHQRVLGGG